MDVESENKGVSAQNWVTVIAALRLNLHIIDWCLLHRCKFTGLRSITVLILNMQIAASDRCLFE